MATITKNTVIAMRADINEALKAVGDKYDVDLAAGNATFTDLECTFKLLATVRASAGSTRRKPCGKAIVCHILTVLDAVRTKKDQRRPHPGYE